MINDASVVIGGGNWGIKEADVLGYKLINDEYYARDIDFANSTAAGTYTDSTGVIRRSPYNLAQYSEEFDNAAWSKTGITVTPNVEVAPNGTMTADRIQFSSSNQVLTQTTSLGTGVVCTSSFYVLGTAGQTLLMAAGGLDQLVTLTGSWQRISTTKTSINSTLNVSTFGGATARDIFLWGAQLVEGTEALPYFPTTTRLNVPRIDYRNADGSLSTVGRLLLEPQRTNVAIFSEQFDDANWLKSNATVTANTTVSPDGSQNADTVTFTATATAFCQRAIGGTHESQSHTVSVYARVATGTATFRLKCTHGGVLDYFSSDFTATTTWQRFTFTATFGATVGTSLVYGVINGSNALAKSVIFYGFQTELNTSFATSYIPTTTAAVTRNADSASKTGVSSWIGQTEGTVFVDVNYQAVTGLSMFVSIRPNSTNKIEIYRDGTTIFGDIFGNSVNVLLSRVSNPAGRYKIALAYKSGQTALYINGTSAGTSATAFSFATSMADLSINLRSGPTFIEQAFYNQVMLFPNRLTDSQLQSLTTL
jgi:hypothetical protein